MTRSTVPIAEQTIESLLASIAERTPAPGGGAVAALAGAVASALAGMVTSYSCGKTSLSAHEEDLCRIREDLEQLHSQAISLAEADAEAFRALSALGEPGENDAAAIEAFQEAARGVISIPEQVLKTAGTLLEHCVFLCGRSSRSLASDLAIAAILGEAAARAAGWNIRVNLPLLASSEERTHHVEHLEEHLEAIARARAKVEAHVSELA